MPRHLKRGVDASAIQAADAKVREMVEQILADVDAHKDAAVRELSQKFDNWSPTSFKLAPSEVERAIGQVRKRDLDDIRFAQAQVRNFAQKQRATLRDLEVETLPGIVLGHRHIPVDSIGCYVPGGRYPMVASAHMSIVTARVAGVRHIVACAPPFKGGTAPCDRGGDASWRRRRNFRARRRAGGRCHGARHRDHRRGRHDRRARQRLRRRGEAAIVRSCRHRSPRRPYRDADYRRRHRRRRNVRDRSARSSRTWSDVAGDSHHQFGKARARHHEGGRAVARDSADCRTAGRAWADFGEVILCDDDAEMVREADRIASEHVQVMTRDPDYFLNNMKNYGSLFLGPRTNVAYGDKVIGTNHTLPTRKAARYTGGLWVGKFLKTCTYQRVNTDAASAMIGEYCSRLCMLEGFVAHAEQANVRVRRYGGRNVPYAHAAE